MKAASLEAAFHALVRSMPKEHAPPALRPCWLGPRPPVLWRTNASGCRRTFPDMREVAGVRFGLS
jgi:hypothetical protein